MAQGTDLFDSSKGQFSDYATLIGGQPPRTDSWFIDHFENINNVDAMDITMFVFTGSAIYPCSQTNEYHSFLLTQNTNLKNCVEILDFNTGSSVTDFTISARGRVVSDNTFIFGQVDNSAKKLRILKRVSGVNTELAVPVPVTNLQPSRQYWLVLIFVDNIVRCELWSEDPRTATDPIARTTCKLSNADTTTFNVSSAIGVWNWLPISLDTHINSIEVGNAFYDSTDAINTVTAQKHVDIRDFINYRHPIRYRTMKELHDFHITEKAFSQNITLTDQALSGTFNLLFYPADIDPYVPFSIGPIAYDASDAAIKSKLNTELNKLPRFSVTTDDPIKNVSSKISLSDKTLMVEFNESFGSMSLLQMKLDSLGRQVAFTGSSNLITISGHTYINGNPIRFSNISGTSGINVDVDYYVINSAENVFQISTSPGGSAVDLTGDGTGTEVLKGNFGSIQSDESYDPATKTGYLYPTVFDNSKFIETADPLNKSLTLDDLRVEYAFKNENWMLYRGTNAALAPVKSHFRENDLIVGKILSRGNRRGADLSFSRAIKKIGGKWSVFLQSSWNSVNCKTIGNSSGLNISIVFDDFPWDPASGVSVLDISGTGCYVQFTSNPSGMFLDQGGDASTDSNKVYLNSTTLLSQSGSPVAEFRAPMSSFETENVAFDFARITGVRIFFKGATASSASSVKIMSVRSIPQTNNWMSAEINTLEQTVGIPTVGFDESTLEIPPMMSGRNVGTIGSDIRPVDSKQSIIFQTGLGDGGDYNKLMMFAREQEYDALQRSTWLTAEYGFMNNDSYVRRYQTLRVASNDNIDTLYWDLHSGGIFEDVYDLSQSGLSYLPRLNEEINYEFSAIFQGNSIGVQIQELTSAEQPQRVIYDGPIVSSGEWNTIGGRIGWHASISDADLYLSSFDLDSASYAKLVTKQFISETPVEGAQLFTVDSGDKNLFEQFFPLSQADRVYVDNQKSVSGEGSYVFESFGDSKNPGAVSNQFTVNDWNHIYIEFDIWIPKVLNKSEIRPKLMLRPAEQPEGTSGIDVFSGVIPANAPVIFDFIPGAWSHVTLDLRGTNAKNGDYFLVLVSDGDGEIDNSSFRNKWWIDNVNINTQTIEWEMRSIENGSWTPFRKNVNRQYGGLHLPETQVGRNVQLQAKALTEDAWIAEYTLIPKYSSLGRILENNKYMVEGHAIVGGLGSGLYSTINSESVVFGAMNEYAEGRSHIFSSGFHINRDAYLRSDSGVVLGKAKISALSRTVYGE